MEIKTDHFVYRHTGPRKEDIPVMLKQIGMDSLDALIDKTIPKAIRLPEMLKLKPGVSEHEYARMIRVIASKNKIFRTYIGMGYYNSITPAVIQRNILENPGWYTSYTPYQAEISQGRLEALLNFQTVILELTGMQLANASLLDEGTAAAEAMIMLFNARTREAVAKHASQFFVDENIFPQTVEVVKTRAEALDIEIITGRWDEITIDERIFGVLLQYPAGDGKVNDYSGFVAHAKSKGASVAVAADIMSLVLLVPPGRWGVDVVVGSTQRFGIPMGYGGPHAAYFATTEAYKRHIPGRIIGVTIDREQRPALRMALQTREQHIKREKATSNICTAQALLATMAGMYAVYHGPDGLKTIATRIHQSAVVLSDKLEELGCVQENRMFFDTLRIRLPHDLSTEDIKRIALEHEVNFRYFTDGSIGISVDETTHKADIEQIVGIFSAAFRKYVGNLHEFTNQFSIEPKLIREDNYMDYELFRAYRSETEMMRYIKYLERKDFSLTHSMISLGSCTMKLNAAIEMLPLSWPAFGELHPFVPLDQAEGYQQLLYELGGILKEITGMQEISFQPNSGAAGEYAGLLVIRKYHLSRNEPHRDIVLIPASAHGTNPASAAMAGMKVVVVNCDEQGNIDLDDLKLKSDQYKDNLAAFMVTYPSTHGVFESAIKEMADIVHQCGGQVYMDGANLNAQVGLTSPAIIGADVCHLNLHKTFAIPHGGGGPGMGPIAVADHLVSFLPAHPVVETGGVNGITSVSSAPWGSASILVISHAYCFLLGAEGLTYASKIAILNANYLASCLKNSFKVLYTGEHGTVAHEMILDCRNFRTIADVTEADIAKRLMDYGYHAPTLSFPVHGTLMVEPTESESLKELDRFVEALRSIYDEIQEIAASGNKSDNLLKNAPHTEMIIASENWTHPYTRKQAAFPVDWSARNKFWPAVSRIDDAFGDRNLVCSCLPLEANRI
jgi:glycine dehydrogenase